MARVKWIFLILGVCLFRIQTTSLAGGGSSEAKEEIGLKDLALGIGVLYYKRPYKGVGDAVYPVPIIVGEYKGFYSDGKSVGYYLNKDEALRFSVVASPRFLGYQGDDSYELSGMEGRNRSIDGGLRAEWINKLFSLKATAVTDLLNNHQGQEIKTAFSKELLKGFITPKAGSNGKARIWSLTITA